MPIPVDQTDNATIATQVLVRYGAVPEVVRARAMDVGALGRSAQVVVETHRGPELGMLLEIVSGSPEPAGESRDSPPAGRVLRAATADDVAEHRRWRERADAEFPEWERRIREWNIDLQLIDLEWTLDGEKLVLYVLNERGPECTKLALQAAAAGLGVIEVQPVSTEGLKPPESPGGCGSCGCGT